MTPLEAADALEAMRAEIDIDGQYRIDALDVAIETLRLSDVKAVPLLDEIDSLRRWKAEATEVIDGWESVWDALDRPGSLGSSKHEAALAEIEKRLS